MWVVVVDMEEELEAAEPPAKHSIFRVPRRFRKHDDSFYKPKTVSLGPFHHEDPDLLRMRVHKVRAVKHFLRRAGKPLAQLVATVEKVADELEAAYADLDVEWRGANRGRFLEMMINDGCFLMEMIWRNDGKHANDYTTDDPVFGDHGVRHTAPYIRRDMLLIENQLPLLLLERIDAFATKPPNRGAINLQVLNFLTWKKDDDDNGTESGDDQGSTQGGGRLELGLHPLGIYRKSRLRPPKKDLQHGETQVLLPHGGDGGSAGNSWFTSLSSCLDQSLPRVAVVPYSARKLYEMGVRFEAKEPNLLDNVDFDRGKLTMPKLVVDDSTEYELLNMMAFEALHASTTNDVTAYVLFVKDVIESADDVALLVDENIIKKELADSDQAVVRLFNNLTKDVVKYGDSTLCDKRKKMEEYCRSSKVRVYLYRGWFYLWNKYFAIPWKFLALIGAIIYLVPDVLQTIYAVLSYRYQKTHPN